MFSFYFATKCLKYSSTISQVVYKNLSKLESLPKIVRKHNRNEQQFIQEQVLSNVLVNSNTPTGEEWKNLKQDVLSKGNKITEVNFDANVIEFCTRNKNYNAAKSFIHSFKLNCENFNLAAVGKFMKLYYVCNEAHRLKKIDEDLILSMYNDLKTKYSIFPSITAENLILAISLTKEWKQCLELLETVKLTTRPNTSVYSAIISAAFFNNEDDLGWKLMEEVIALDRLPGPVVYHTWIDKVKTQPNVLRELGNLFDYFSDNDILPTKDVTDKISEIYQNRKYSCNYTTISKTGVCQCCNGRLKDNTINSNEFEQLKNTFMENVIIGKNIFNKTTPTELERFKKFIANLGPQDVVIDGLNVAYTGGSFKSSYNCAKLVANVVEFYVEKNKKVVVLGRTHMNKWPKKFMAYISTNAQLFLTDNISQDDPFLLYTTMSSGLGTVFVSRDLMRGHLYLVMKPNLKRTFRRWQQLYQHSIKYVENNGKVHMNFSYKFLPTAQRCLDGWHIPFTENYSSQPVYSLDPPVNWLCIQKLRK